MEDQYAYDASGNPILDAYNKPVKVNTAGGTAAKYTTGYNPILASPADVKAQRKEAWETVGAQSLVGAGLTAAQIGLAAIPTAADEHNEAELKKLTDLEKAGQLGLSAGQRQQAEATTMNPVRALATEGRQRGEAFLASGGGGDVAGMQRENIATKKAVSDAAVRAGIAINEADLAAEERQRLEMEQRREYKSGRQKQPFEMIGQALGAAAPVAGKVAAGFAQAREPYDAELLAFATAKDSKGNLLHPGWENASVADLRAAWASGKLLAPMSPDTQNKLAAGAIQGGSVP